MIEAFFEAVFAPGDWLTIRPVETWTEGGQRRSRVDYEGICCEHLGLRTVDGRWVTRPGQLAGMLQKCAARAAEERTNLFYGVCPRFGGEGRYEKAWQIRVVRTLWADLDHCTPEEGLARCRATKLPEPTIVVASGHGAHLYWALADPYVIDDVAEPPQVHSQWSDAPGGRTCREYILDRASRARLYLAARQNVPSLTPKAEHLEDILVGVAQRLGGDHVQDLARLLRIPDTLNRKDERNGRPPVPCRIVTLSAGRRYGIAEFAALALDSPARRRRQQVAQVKLPPCSSRLTKRQQTRLHDLANASAVAEPGTRSEADFALCAYAIEHGMPRSLVWTEVARLGKFAEAGESYFDRTWSAAEQHTRERIFLAARSKSEARQQAKQSENQAADQPTPLEADDDPHRLARLYLDRYASHEPGITLRRWHSEWWRWNGRCYVLVSDDDQRADLALRIKEEFDRLNIEAQDRARDNPPEAYKVTRPVVTNALSALESLTTLDASLEPPTWLDGRSARTCLSMENGLLDLEALLGNAPADQVLLPHTPQWFSPVCLPYPFDPDADCPRWKRVTAENLDHDPQRLAIAQEWAGYLLTPDTGMQRFMVLEGEGANGKSVYCAGLEAILGRENVSHVPLELFAQRFALTSTLGKLANIAAECGELDRVAEGYLKSFTGGDRMTFDRKNKSPVEASPSARLVLSTNNRPRFSDRSGGLWRRMLLMPFLSEVAEDRRVYGMDKPEWWQRAGELPGMFNWAVAGLYRLRQQRRFTHSALCSEAVEDYRLEVNPARAFLVGHYEHCEHASVGTADLYEAYAKWCRSNGYHPLGERQFGKEVRRTFPRAQRRRGGSRGDRFWFYGGIAEKNDAAVGFA